MNKKFSLFAKRGMWLASHDFSKCFHLLNLFSSIHENQMNPFLTILINLDIIQVLYKSGPVLSSTIIMEEWDTQKQLEACTMQTHVMQYLDYNHREFVHFMRFNFSIYFHQLFRGSCIIYFLKSDDCVSFSYRGLQNIQSDTAYSSSIFKVRNACQKLLKLLQQLKIKMVTTT